MKNCLSVLFQNKQTNTNKHKQIEEDIKMQSVAILLLSSVNPAYSHWLPEYKKFCSCCLFIKSNPVPFFFCSSDFLNAHFSDAVSRTMKSRRMKSSFPEENITVSTPRGYHYIIVMWVSTYSSLWGIHISDSFCGFPINTDTLVTKAFEYFYYFLCNDNV